MGKASLLLALSIAAGCATAQGKRVPMGCLDTLSQECDDPSAYPPLTAQLPKGPPGMRPFPRLLPEQKPIPPQPETPAGRLLKKLGK
jgi:hypothetical protein